MVCTKGLTACGSPPIKASNLSLTNAEKFLTKSGWAEKFVLVSTYVDGRRYQLWCDLIPALAFRFMRLPPVGRKTAPA